MLYTCNSNHFFPRSPWKSSGLGGQEPITVKIPPREKGEMREVIFTCVSRFATIPEEKGGLQVVYHRIGRHLSCVSQQYSASKNNIRK